jgi:tRNA A-37 threonylcarbamoyl transferase component Bud32
VLSKPDRRVVERDPDLPGLATLFDLEATAELLARLYPEARIESAEATYLRYKPGTSCLVGYRVRLGAGGETLAYARASRPDRPEKVYKATRRTPIASALGGGPRVEPAQAVTVFPFPHDLRLRALARVGDPERRRALLRDLLPERHALWSASLEPLRHKPERRFVGRLGGDAIVKLYAEGELAGASDAVTRLRSDPPLRLPALLGLSTRHRLCAIEWLEGEPLDRILRDTTRSLEPFRSSGAALARLHRQDARLERVVDRKTVARSARATARDLGALQPELGPRCDRLAGRLERLLDGADQGRPITLHGDFSPDQILVRGEDIAIVDLDDAARGEAAIDLAAFGASMIAEAAAEGLDRDRARAAYAALLEGYRAAAPGEPANRLGTFTAAALLRRAVEPFRLRDPRWPEANAAILDEAEAMVAASVEVEALP